MNPFPRDLFQVFRTITHIMVSHITPEPDELNKFFAKISRTLSDRIAQASQRFLVGKVVESMALSQTNRDEITKFLSRFKSKMYW